MCKRTGFDNTSAHFQDNAIQEDREMEMGTLVSAPIGIRHDSTELLMKRVRRTIATIGHHKLQWTGGRQSDESLWHIAHWTSRHSQLVEYTTAIPIENKSKIRTMSGEQLRWEQSHQVIRRLMESYDCM